MILAKYPSNDNEKWDNLALISKDYEEGYDLILAYDDKPKDGDSFKCRSLMLGHWNDGVV